jgi:hypothetical protein
VADDLTRAAWFVDRRERVFRRVADFVERSATSPAQRHLLETALTGLREQAEQHLFCPFVHVPLLVYAGIGGDDERALPLAVVTSLLYLGFDTLDDLADGDLPNHWSGLRVSEIHLVAAGLLGALPILALVELDASPETIVELQRTVACGLMLMGQGQQRDLRLANSSGLSSGDVENTIEAKSGEEFAMFAALAARLAGGSATTVVHYADFARALGAGLQLASDCQDLFFEETSRDLRNGTRTLPIALFLESTSGAGRIDFLRLLDQCRCDDAAQRTLRQRLRAAGTLWQARLFVEAYRQRALAALEQAAPRLEVRPMFELPLSTIALLQA